VSQTRPRYLGRAARLLWGGLGVVFLVFLGLSFLLSGSALEDAEADAEQRAQSLAASVLFTNLTPDLVSGDILGPDYRDLLIRVQAGILSDDRIVQVRVWKPDGDLIFSTAQRDAIDEFVSQDDPNLERAAAGEIVSAIAEATVAPRQGLQGSDEKLLQTYVPLQPADSTSVTAVVQIDQRYAAIEDEANRIWRPIQIGLIVPLGIVAVLFGISLRAVPEAEPKPREVRRDERRLKDAEARATSAERAAREVEERLAEAERRLRDASASEVPPDVAARVDELDLKLRAEVAEREQFAGEVQRLRTTLAEREAELARIRDATPPPAEPEGVRELIASTERRAEDAEARLAEAATDAERQVREATALAGAAETRATQAEAMTKEAEERAEAAEATIAGLRASLVDAESRLTASEAKLLEAAQRVGAAEQPAAAARGRSRGKSEGDAEERAKELEGRLEDLEAKRRSEVGELQRAQESYANTQVELREMQRKLKAAEERVRELESGPARPPAPSEAPAPAAASSASGSWAAPTAEEEPSLEFGSFASRLSSLRQELASQIGSEQEGDAAEEPPSEEALSLRERLARAAAARHRVGGGTDEE
jgi:chromosome segregation ATPase